MNLSRRSLLTGLISFAVTAPAIVRAASIMPVKLILPEPMLPPATWRMYSQGVLPYTKNVLDGGGSVTAADSWKIDWAGEPVEPLFAHPWLERMKEGLKTPDRKWFALKESA